MRSRSAVALALLAVSCGCTHRQLTSSTALATSTVMDIQYQIVLMNLALLSCHPESYPSHIDLSDGVVQINDSLGFGNGGGLSTFGGGPFGIDQFGPDGSRQVIEQWGADATTDPQRLTDLQDLYRLAIGLPPLPPPNAIAYLPYHQRAGDDRRGGEGGGSEEGSSGSPSTTSTGGGGTLAVRGWVPFHPQAAGVRYLYGGRVIHETRRSPEPPRVRLAWQPDERVSGRHRVEWQARAADEDAQPLEFFLRYSCNGGQRWHRISLRTTENALEVGFDDLPGGDACLLAVVATDGINATEVHSPRFSVPVKPCHVTILSPVDGSRHPHGQMVACIGSGFFLEENRSETETLEWSSSLDGALGRGPALALSSLSQGTHRIRLSAGRGDRQGNDEVTIQVGEDEEGTESQCS